jgi:hypothetical protein
MEWLQRMLIVNATNSFLYLLYIDLGLRPGSESVIGKPLIR